MKVIPLEKKLSSISLKSYLWMQYTEEATAPHSNERKVTWLPGADELHHLDHFRSLDSSWRLLLIADSHFEASLLIYAFPNASHLRKEAKQRKNDFQRETPCPGKTCCLAKWAQETRLRNRCFDSPPPQPVLCDEGERSFPFGMQHSPFHDLGHSWPKGQQPTSHTISINDKSLIIYAVCKGIFFWKCTHCLVIYLLRSLIKGQQS